MPMCMRASSRVPILPNTVEWDTSLAHSILGDRLGHSENHLKVCNQFSSA